MPDIDSDFCFRRRDEVVDYISRRYGKDYVAQIVTFGTMASKAAIRDVGRVLEKPLADIDRLAKSATTLAGASDPELEDVLDLARQIENMPRQTGIHAAGVIIGAEPLINTIPTRISDGHVITQYDMGICEEIGLLKMDILGLRTLTVIDDALNLIPEKFDINRIPLDDQEVYHLLSNGNTVGVFQVESDGMQRILKQLKPDSFQDLIAMVALYRPGPLGSGMVEDYIECKHGRKTPVYLHPVLEPILKETHGVMLYQEQVMRIATDMAGFSLPDADLMRKAVSKKKPEVLKAQREKFVAGAEANGISKEISSQVFDLIDYFSGYGFNKSHSAAYALIAYQTAWLKAHYPREFVAALLSNTTDQDKIAVIINECRRLNIKILPPDINKSGREFMLDGDAIRFGLGAVKGLGDAVIKQILSSRPFKDPYDLAYKGLNKAAIETLAFSGCLTAFGTRRATVLSVPAILKAPTLVGREEQTLFGTGEEMLPEIEDIPEFSLDELLRLEKEYLGFYVSAHPLDRYKLPPHKPISAIDKGDFTVAGIVTKSKTGFKTKHWAALTIEDYTGTLEVLVFDKEPIDIKIGQPYVFKGRVQEEEGKHKLFARQYRSVA